MMDKSIKNGDRVKVVWVNDTWMTARVLNMPRGNGDLLQVEEENTGKIMTINPYASDFSCLVKEKEE